MNQATQKNKHWIEARGVLSILATVAALFMGAATAASNAESTGDYIDDSVITAKVKAALVADPELKAMEINVETFKGTVQLSGFVAEPSDIGKAGQVARDVKGVKSVKNDVRVK